MDQQILKNAAASPSSYRKEHEIMSENTNSTKAKRKKARCLNARLLRFAKAIEETSGVQLAICKRKRKPRKLLTTEQAARALGRKKHTMENWRSIGDGPTFHKVGGSILYDRKDILQFLADRKFNSTSAYFAPPINKEAKSWD